MSTTTSITAARALSTRDLVQELLTNESHAHVIRRVCHERLTANGVPLIYDLVLRDANGGTIKPQSDGVPWEGGDQQILLSHGNFPWRDEELVLSWMQTMQPWQLAERVEAEGYGGEFMRNPKEAMDWVKTAIYSKTEWRDIHPEAVRFWKALYSKFSRWIATGKPAV